MKRTLFVAGAVAFTALGCFYYLNLQSGTFVVTATGILAAVTLFLYFTKRASKIWVAVTIPLFLFSALYFYHLYTFVLPVVSLQGHRAQVVAQVISAPEWDANSFVCRVQTESIALQDAPQRVKLLLRVFKLEDVAVGDVLRTTVTFDAIDRSFYAEGVYVSGSTSALEQVALPENTSVLMWLEDFRKSIRSTFNRNLPDELAGYVQALLLGDKSRLTTRIKSAYQVCGLSHLLAVSGLHLSLLCAAFGKILAACRLGRRQSAGLMMALVVAVMAVTGFSASVVRAGCMYLLMLLGRLVLRKGEPLNSLGGALLIMLLGQPFSAGSLSLLLSAGSVAGILLLGPYLQNVICRYVKWYGLVGKALRYVAQMLAMTLSAVLTSLPALILVYGEVSWLSVPANLFISGVSGVLLILAVVGLLFYALAPIKILLIPVFWCTTQLADYCTAVPVWLSRVPFAASYAGNAHICICVGFSILIVSAGLLLRPMCIRGMFCAALCLLLVCCSCFTYTVRNRHTTHIAVIPGEWGCSVVLTNNRTAVVIGLPTGAYGSVYTHLRSRGISKVSALLLPGCDALQDRQTASLEEMIPISHTLQAPLPQVQELQPWPGANIRFYPHNYGYACRIQLGQKVCFVSMAGVDFTKSVLSIGPVDLLICDAAPPTGLITRPDTVCLLGNRGLPAYLAAADLSLQGMACYISPQGTKTVAKLEKNGYSSYSIEK